MYKPEQKFISKELIPWLKHHLPISMAWEAKHISIKEKHYNYKSDKSLQKEITNLKIAGRRLVYKIPDGSLAGTPFDGVCLSEAQGYFFFKFEAEKKKFFAINVNKLEAEASDGKKSLSSARAEEIADFTIDLTNTNKDIINTGSNQPPDARK